MENAIVIENLLANKKDKNLRLFDTLDIVELGQTLCAYLNGAGGDIILGIGSDKTPTGIEKKWNNRIYNEVLNKLTPSAPVTSNIISYQNTEVLLISAWPG